VTNLGIARLAFKLVGLWLMATTAIGVAGIPYCWSSGFSR